MLGNSRLVVARVVIAVLAGGLIGGNIIPAAAQGTGSELAEEVATDATDYVAVLEISAFNADGGEAVFEPQTPNAETFTYDAIDPEARRLLGLTRTAPTTHPAGSFVAVAASEATPTPPQSPEPTPPPANTGAEEEATASSATPGADEDASPAESGVNAGPDPCDAIFGQSCIDEILEIVGENPCDDGTGRNCEQMIADEVDWAIDTVLDIVGENPCDDGTGRDCQGMVQDEIDWALFVVGTLWDEVQGVVNHPCVANPSCVPTDPCPSQTVEECTGIPEVNFDPEDLVVDDVYNSVADDGDCSVGVAPPAKVQDSATGTYYVLSYGEANCPGYDDVEVTTCIQIKTPDGWKRKNCTSGTEFGEYDAATTLAPCAAKTHKYRTKFTWLAVYITGAIDNPGVDDAPSSGTKKVPLTGTKITCPP